MRQFWLAAHMVGMVLWLGGAVAAMAVGITGRREGRGALALVVRLQGGIYRIAITPGALLTVVSGLILTLRMYDAMQEMTVWLMVMQGTGLLAGILTLVMVVPTSARLTRLDPNGEHAAYFDRLRGRQMIAAMSAGTLGMVGLIAGALMR
jgi:hypothetical protein